MPPTEFPQSLILDAAKACYLRHGVAKTTAADIANEAGVSRATLYRRFPSHNDIFLAALARDSWEMVEVVGARLEHIEDPAEHMIEGLLSVLDEVVRRPLHAHLFSDTDGTWPLSQVLGTDDMRDLSLQMMRAMPGMPETLSKQSEQKLVFIAEWVLRILTSYAANPSQVARDRDEMRNLLETTLAPAVRAFFAGVQSSSSRLKQVT